MVTTALIAGFTCSIRSRYASSNSRLPISRARSARTRALAGAEVMSPLVVTWIPLVREPMSQALDGGDARQRAARMV
jgi:hypothetical protein